MYLATYPGVTVLFLPSDRFADVSFPTEYTFLMSKTPGPVINLCCFSFLHVALVRE